MQQCSFSPALIHLNNRWRSLAWLGICNCCQQELWMGRQADRGLWTHTHNKQRVYCTDAARVTVAKFRLHLNKGIRPTPLIGYRTHKSTVCSDIIPACTLWLYVSYMYNIKSHSVTDPTETKSCVRPKCLCSFWSVVKPQFPQLTNSHRHHSF